MATADRKEREKEQRKNVILDAAEKLFFSKGFDSVSMEEIAKEVELGKGTLYLYFKSKDSLFFAIISRKWIEFGKILTEKMSQGKTGFEKIQILIRWYIEYAQKNADYNDMATTFGPQLFQRIDAEDARMMMEVSMKYIPLVHAAVREGIEDGSVRNDLDPTLLGMYLQMITFNVVSPDPSMKNGFATQGISYDKYVEMLPKFLCPAVARFPEKECDN
ncbi:MAG: TetR/AcrR family transcriptional regulator [Methanosarcina barkeri]|nr:TetR/AcrR family transcriptional regulator [Methanosarcina sp. ERenArc_MAG2]